MSEAECVINSKAEFHQSPWVGVVAVTGLQEEQRVEPDVGQGGRGRGRGREGRGARGRRARGRGSGTRS